MSRQRKERQARRKAQLTPRFRGIRGIVYVVANAKSDGKMAQLQKLDQTLEDHKCQAKI